MPAGTKFSVLAPLIRAQKGEYRDLFVDLLKQGFARARVDGATVIALTDELDLDRQMRHNIEVVVDRLVAGQSRGRLAEAVELALKLGQGNLIVAREDASAPPRPQRHRKQKPKLRTRRLPAAASDDARPRRPAAWPATCNSLPTTPAHTVV